MRRLYLDLSLLVHVITRHDILMNVSLIAWFIKIDRDRTAVLNLCLLKILLSSLYVCFFSTAEHLALVNFTLTLSRSSTQSYFLFSS